MKQKPAKPTNQNPYKILYWMGAALLVLAIGVVALIMLSPKPSGEPGDPERTLLWLYDSSAPEADTTTAIVIEESRSRGLLTAVPFAPPADLRAVYGGKNPKKAQEEVAAQTGREVAHRVFLPYTVVQTLVDAAGGVKVEGKALNGAQAVTYIRDGKDQAPGRAAQVMLALAAAVNTNGVNMSAGDGLKLARQVDTDIDLMAIPDVLGRWSGYATPRIQVPSSNDPKAMQNLLLPDSGNPAR